MSTSMPPDLFGRHFRQLQRQPDGNFVAYDQDGVVRWSSDTYN